MQKTLSEPLEISGVGLHSGVDVKMVIHPAPKNSGIVFVRSDLATKPELKASYDCVVDTRNCTCLGNEKKEIVSTIEHIMAALYAVGVDNARIEINNAETPIMDGGAKVFYDMLKKVPLKEQSVKRKMVKVLREVLFVDDKGAGVILKPADNLDVHFVIEFPSKIVGHQEFDGAINEELFAEKIAPCRTFCEKYQIDYLRSIGLIKGGSLDNALVLDGDKLLNEGGFRVDNEPVNHKVLDCIGDMYTAGYRLLAKIEANKSGHYHNNEVLKKLFSDPNNYQIIEE